MRIRRCAILLIEPSEKLEFSYESLLSGGVGLESSLRWMALAAHLEAPVEIDSRQLLVLGQISKAIWSDFAPLAALHDKKLLLGLLKSGLLIGSTQRYSARRERDELVRSAHWHAPAAALHLFGRWEGIKTGEGAQQAGLGTMQEMIAALGPPPAALVERTAAKRRIGLRHSAPGPIDDLLRQRVTCRNYDTSSELAQRDFSRLLRRVFGVQGRIEVGPETLVLKKTSPSGGGLHPIDAYLLVQRVSGVRPGLYHYHAGDHALEPLPGPPLSGVRKLASLALAGQEYFADASVLVILSARFARTQWKYRNHSKAYRAVMLEAGHLSQTLYLTATELGLGAFISAAINEKDIERAFRLDPLIESPIAICGFGRRAKHKATVEFDPQNAVWPAPPTRSPGKRSAPGIS